MKLLQLINSVMDLEIEDVPLEFQATLNKEDMVTSKIEDRKLL
jgi:hypothetical protein